MISEKKNIIVDIDGTLCPVKKEGENYIDIEPYSDMVTKLLEYKDLGFRIILNTSRNVRTYDGNVGLINKHTARVLLEWLDKHNIPYDEIYYCKPWQGKGGFYIDDKTIRPNEFLKLSYEEILSIVEPEKNNAF
jgi:capsule biosynthesis phosphatase